jgi:hypothetical protein
MTPPSRTESDENQTGETPPAERLAAAVAASVLRALGKPPDLSRVAVVRLWGSHYRVNVQTGTSATFARVAHSYFLAVDEAGAIRAANPAIARLY